MLHWFAKRMTKSYKDERGFTLIELLVVVIIIGILAAIAIPTFLSQRSKAQDADAQSAVRNAATSVKSISTGCEGLYKLPTACAAAITFADAANPTVGGDAALAKYAPPTTYNGTVTVPGDFKSFTVKVTSKSGKTAIFDSNTGSVTVSP